MVDMKYALIIPDGAADEPQEALAGRTPLQSAATPYMDVIVRAGVVGRADHIPVSMPSGSDVGTMSLFGYDPLEFHSGRAPLEAAAQGIKLGPDDWAVRCNLVTIENGLMQSFTAGQIPSDLAASLIGLLQQDLPGSEPWTYYTGVSYRNLLIGRFPRGGAPFGPETKTVPPHDLTDRPVAEDLPKGPGSQPLRRLMDRSKELFAESPANRQRRACGQLLASQIWLWGEGRRPALEPFTERYGVTVAVITAVDLLRGIGKLLGCKIIDVPGATGYLDTDYVAKGLAAIQTLQEVDLVVVHVEATDEASHEGDAAAKVTALERIDGDVVGPIHEYLQSQGEYRMLVSPDHPTFLRTKTHSHGYVPFAMCGRGIIPDRAAKYDEPTADSSTLVIDAGHELMPIFLQTLDVDGEGSND